MTDSTLLNLVNPEFKISFMEKDYQLRKATLDKAVQYQQKIKETENDPAQDSKLIAFCIFIMLKEKEPDLTEQQVFENLPADLDYLEVLTMLGFINPSRLAVVRATQEAVMKKLTIAGSLSSSEKN